MVGWLFEQDGHDVFGYPIDGVWAVEDFVPFVSVIGDESHGDELSFEAVEFAVEEESHDVLSGNGVWGELFRRSLGG